MVFFTPPPTPNIVTIRQIYLKLSLLINCWEGFKWKRILKPDVAIFCLMLQYTWY